MGQKQISSFLILIVIFSTIPILHMDNSSGDLSNPSALTPHSTIYIYGNTEFTLTNGVVGGDGTQNNPFIIEDWYIDAKSNGHGIHIRDTSKHFIIRNCHILNADIEKDNQKGIYLNGVSNGAVLNCRIEKNHQGLYATMGKNNIISNFIIFNLFKKILHFWIVCYIYYCFKQIFFRFQFFFF